MRRLSETKTILLSTHILQEVEAMCNRVADYTEYINANADRIHFNRYTGVAMK